jgi:RNA polymerase sigma-70 factor (ECF subfamily)
MEELLEETATAHSSADGETAIEDQLIAAAMRGDRAAFEQLASRFHHEMFARAYQMLGNAADAEDEVQNAWIKAWARRSQYSGTGNLRAWLCRIVTNNCLMRLRRRRRFPSVSLDAASHPDSFERIETVCLRPTPEASCSWRQIRELVRREISLLPVCYRAAILLHDIERLTVDQVATRLDLSVPATKSRIARGRAELGRRITGEKDRTLAYSRTGSVLLR